MGPTRKRVLIIFSVFGIMLIIKLLLFNGVLLVEKPDYRHTPGVPLLVTVFYETLCIDSKHFILKQLLPAYKKLSPLIEVQFVPYGKATTNIDPSGTITFDCQHGSIECDGNKYHACAVEAIHDPETRVNMIACMIVNNRDPKEAMYRCAKENNVDSVELIQKCHDTHGNDLLKLNGEASRALRPPISFIPTITLDGAQFSQAAILKNLSTEICAIIGDTKEAEQFCRKQEYRLV